MAGSPKKSPKKGSPTKKGSPKKVGKRGIKAPFVIITSERIMMCVK